MAVAGVGIERDVAQHADVGHLLLDRADGAADQIVGIERLAAVVVAQRRDRCRGTARCRGWRASPRVRPRARPRRPKAARRPASRRSARGSCLPSTTKSGQIRSSVVSTFSRTMRRAHSVRRLRRGRVVQVERVVLAAGSPRPAQTRASGSRCGRPYLMAMDIPSDAVIAGTGSGQAPSLPGILTWPVDRRSPRRLRDRWISSFPRSSGRSRRPRGEFARDEMMPHARDWDENETFPVETLRKAAALGFGGIYVQGRCRRLGAVAARRHDHLRGAGAGLHLDRRLYLDPQHGGLDDRRASAARRSASASCRSSARWSISRAIA